MSSPVICDRCGDEVSIQVGNIVTHGSCDRGCHGQTHSVMLQIGCSCQSETAQATELTSLTVDGSPPDEWV